MEHVQTDNWNSPGTWEILLLPRQQPDGDTGLSTPGLGGALVRRGAKATSASEVSPSEGNEVRRDGQQEVVAPHSTDEAGELVPLDPVEGRQNRKGCLMLDPGLGNTSEALNLELRITVTAQDSIRVCSAAAWRIQHQRNRML